MKIQHAPRFVRRFQKQVPMVCAQGSKFEALARRNVRFDIALMWHTPYGEDVMTRLKLLGVVAALSTAIASPAFAQALAGPLGPGSRYGLEPEPGPVVGQGYGPEQGAAFGPRYGHYYDENDTGFAPFDAAAGIVDGAVNTAGAIVTAPFRALDGPGSFAMMGGDASYCAQRYRSFDPRSGTYLGLDGHRHRCG
jgi:hypothetical protein